MANSVENRIVNMVFNSAKFQAGVTQTIASLTALDGALQKLDSSKGLENLQKALDGLNFAKMAANAEAAKGKINFNNEAASLDQLEQKSSRISFGGILRGLASIKSKLTFGRDAQQQFGQAETASRNVRFAGANQAIDQTKQGIDGIGSGADAAFGDINNAAGRVSLNPLTVSTAAATQGFTVLKGAAATALGTIAAQAATAGAGLVKDLSLGPITDGFSEYATNLSSIQTILANTQAEGANLQDVNKALGELNHYSDQTIYNFGEMAKNIGTFTAAGVELKPATESIKGIANLAALSGSSSAQASSAMYQLSQAIAAGKVNLEDWNSVVNSGMGGKVFQKALFDTGKAMGTITNSPVGQTFKQWEKSGNSFRQSLSATNKAANSGTKDLAEAQKEGAESVADAQENAAEAVENAKKRVVDAQKAVGEAAKDGAETVKNAVKDQKETFERSAQNVKDAFEQVKEARQRLKDAMKPPSQDELEAATDNLKTAQLDQKDLADAVTDAQEQQRRSGDDLAKAQQNLSAVQRRGGNADELKAAQNAVYDAQQAVKDAADAQERALLRQRAAARGVNDAEKDLQETRKKGTKNDENVKAAQDDLTASLKQYKDAQIQQREDIANADKRVAEAKENSAERQKQAGESLVEAEKQQAKTIKNSAESIAGAQEAAAKRVEAAKEQMESAKNGGGPPSWLTSDVLTETLKQFTGDLTDAQLKAKGFTDEQIKAIQKTAQVAKKSATEVKTIKQVFEVAKESIGSGFAQTFQLIFGNFNESKKTFTGFSTAIGDVINNSAKARNKVLMDWRELGGRSVLFEGLKEAIRGIGELLKPIKDGFRQIFPASTGKTLYDATVRFRDLAKSLSVAPETADKVKRTFAGLFSILKIGTTVVKAIGSGIKAFFDEVSRGDGSGGFLDLTSAIGDWLVKVSKALEEGEGLRKFFQGLGRAIAKPVIVIQQLASKLAGLFGGFDATDGEAVSTGLSDVGDSADKLQSHVGSLGDAFDRLKERLGQAVEILKDAAGGVIDAIKETFSGANYDDVIAGVEAGLFGGLVLMITRFLKNGFNFDIGGGFFEKMTDLFDQLTDTLTALQQNIQADTLRKIAIAIGLLAAALVALSLIDPKRLATALAAIAVGMGQLMAAMLVLTKLAGLKGFYTIPVIASSLILLAAAVDVLAIAVVALSRLSWTELVKGLTATSVLLAGLALSAKPLAAAGPGLVRTGAGLVLVAGALNLLAIAVKKFGDMDVSTIAKGLGSIAAALVLMGVAMHGFPPSMVATGTGILAVSVALNVLAGAVQKFGDMDISTIAKGLGTMATSMVIMGNALRLFPPNTAAIGAGLVLAATGVRIMAGALKQMGNMSVGKIAKSLITLGGSLTILSAALTLMTGTIGGSAALLVAAGALAVLGPALRILGGIKWGSIVKGLITLGASLGLFAAASFALAPATAAMLALGAAILLLGAGIGAAAAGIGVLSTGLAALAVSGPAGIAILVKAIGSLLMVVPQMAVKFAEAFVGIIAVIAEKAPKIVEDLGKMLQAFLQAIINNAPKVGEAFTAMLQTLFKVISDNTPGFVKAGFNVILNFLEGLGNNIVEITKRVIEIVTRFVDTVADNLGPIIDSGVNLVFKFISGVVSKIGDLTKPARDAVGKFISGAVGKYRDVVTGGVNLIGKLVSGIASKIGDMGDKGRQAIGKFISGITSRIGDIFDGGKDAIVKFVNGLTEKIEAVYNKGRDIVNKLKSGIRSIANDVYEVAKSIGQDIVEGIVKGLGSLPKKLAKKLFKPIKDAYGGVKDFLGIKSPSRAFKDIGMYVVEGFGQGLDDNGNRIGKAADGLASNAVGTMETKLKAVPNLLDGIADMDPTITPVLDLSQVTNEAKKLDGLTNVTPITAATSYQMGQSIVDEKATNDAVAAEIAASSNVPTLHFEQKNESPKALSEAEIYRQTNNGLAKAKSMLDDLKKAG